MEAVQQMNVRIPADLKRQGDEELKRLGFTSSAAIRAFYEFVVRNAYDADRVKEVIQLPSDEAAEESECSKRMQRLRDFEQWQKEMFDRIGLSPSQLSVAVPSYEELKEQAYEERLGGDPHA